MSRWQKFLAWCSATFDPPQAVVMCVSQEEADKMLRTGDWRLAPEEDYNRDVTVVYVEYCR